MTAPVDPTRLQAAAELLARGPAHTLDVAREVLGLTGHPGAASAAVFALLGADARFSVGGDGVWTLAPDGPGVGPSLERNRYAVVDVEATGGSYRRGHRIIEIAVVEVRDGAVSSSFTTLVNPGRPIPWAVTRLTGIDHSMVADAPLFEEVAKEVLGLLQGRVFVAHNVPFDWRLVSESLASQLGEIPQVPRLCTVRMARRLLPGLRRRNLDSVAAYYDVDIHDRHRAHGDALATARVLIRLLDEAGSRGIRDFHALEAFVRGSGRKRDPAQLGLPLERS